MRAAEKILAFGLLLLFPACRPTVTVDVPASELDMHINVFDYDENPSDGKVLVVAQFFYGDAYAKLGGTARVSCNNVPLSIDALGGIGYAARVPLVHAGGAYTFTYSRNGASASVGIVTTERPLFVSPTEGANVTRSENVTIQYQRGNGSSVQGRAQGRKTGAGSVSVGAGDQQDNGTYTGLNVVSTSGVGQFGSGAGKISLTREYVDRHTGGAGFHSVKSTYTSGSEINITWR